MGGQAACHPWLLTLMPPRPHRSKPQATVWAAKKGLFYSLAA